MGSSRRRPAWLACGLIAVALSLTGCVNMPSSGPPTSALVNQDNVGQNQAYDGPVPSPPKPGWGPEQIVEGFLFASSSYYTAGATAASYLTPQASRAWKPGGSVMVFQNWKVLTQDQQRGVTQANVTVSGQVQAALNGSGQQLTSAAQDNAPPSSAPGTACGNGDGTYPFTLTKQEGEWRIARAPNCLLLDQDDFQRFWKSQDLYFLDSPGSGTAPRVLVPDSVFVPIGTSETDLLNRLTDALEAGPAASWLARGVSANVFPRAKINVTADDTTAIVNLEGHITPNKQTLQEIAAELVWTLTSASVGQPAIQSVNLEINGTQVFPFGPQQQLDLKTFAAYNPYPAAGPASYSYVDKSGAAQSACGSAQNAVGTFPAEPIFVHGAPMALAACHRAPPSAAPSATATPLATTSPGKPAESAKPGKHTGKPSHGPRGVPAAPTYAQVAVSPDGKEVAVVSSDGDQLSIGTVGVAKPPGPVPGVPKLPITSISWDQQHDLWFTQGGGIWMLAPGGKLTGVTPSGSGTVALTVAPDGVRAAIIQQQNEQQVLELAAINPSGNAAGQPSPRGTVVSPPTIGQPVPLGPDVTDAKAVTWYDTDDLIVLSQDGATIALQEVPVNGRATTGQLAQLLIPAGVMVNSVAAANADSLVIAGLSNGTLEVSAGFEGPWQNAGSGYNPAYWIPPATASGGSP